MKTIETEPAQVLTDATGQIETMSRAARALLTPTGAERGRSLIDCFPEYRKALLFDIEVARAGWATERGIRLPGPTFKAVRYRVSRLLPSGGLYWEFSAAEEDARRSA